MKKLSPEKGSNSIIHNRLKVLAIQSMINVLEFINQDMVATGKTNQ